MLKLNKLLILLAVLVTAIALLPGSAMAAGEAGWTSWISSPGVTSWAYCDYYPDSYGNYGYWCYLQDQGIWESVSPSWQPGSGFSPGENAD